MIPYHGYDTTALVHHHHPAYATNNNPVEQEVPKYARWAQASRVKMIDNDDRNCSKIKSRWYSWQEFCITWRICRSSVENWKILQNSAQFPSFSINLLGINFRLANLPKFWQESLMYKWVERVEENHSK